MYNSSIPEIEVISILFESMGSIIHRTSQLDPYVRLSPHTAPEILSFRFYIFYSIE
jgi:hypothetical protein